MTSKHEAREPGTKPAVWAQSEPGTNKRAGPWQETKHGGLVQPGPFTSKLVKPAFCTKPCLQARFFRAYRAGPARLGPLRAGLG
jgi:hypothetical protein